MNEVTKALLICFATFIHQVLCEEHVRESLSPGDPHSYSRPDLVKTTHVHLDLNVDFDLNILVGKSILSFTKIDKETSSVILDSRNLTIHNITEEYTDEKLVFTIEPQSDLGEKLEIKLPTYIGDRFKIVVYYETSPQSSGLQWLNPEQTAGKQHPFLFSQNQPIHARSMLPCQDTPAVKTPYSASITAPASLTVLMSAIKDPVEVESSGKKTANFIQKVPIPSYLIAIAVGDVVSKRIGPRSHVWSESEYIEKAAFDFSETESFIQTAEELNGPYIWGIYDILVLPPSFPYGGMENPCLTFATPTLLSGDKSNANVIAHEIAHSWSGNLVTNRNSEHFWLNEGFTRFTEQKILGRLQKGEPSRHFAAILGWRKLMNTVQETLGPTNPFTALTPNLTGVDPDDAFSSVPYEKGSTFLWFLEETVGGAAKFEPFIRFYYKNFAFKSIDSSDFKKLFMSYFKNNEAVKSIDWYAWLHDPGMPIWKPNFDDSLAKDCWALAKLWQEWDPSVQAEFGDTFDKFTPKQKQEFLGSLLSGGSLPITKIEKMAELYGLDQSTNTEILFLWIRLGLKAKWEPSVPEALNLVNIQGRMKFVKPLYRDLYKWTEKRQQAIDNFLKHGDKLMYVAREKVFKILHLNQ